MADDEAIAEAVTVTVPDTAAYGEEFSIQIDVPEGYGVVYVSACGTILGADTDVLCTASFSSELEGALDIEIAVASVEGSDVWQYEENGDGTVTITGSTKYSDSEDYLYCIVPAELDGMPVSGFGSGTDNVIYRSSLYAICFQEGIETFAYQALYDLNSCQIGILPASALAIDEGFVRSMPVVTWGINAACDAAQEFVDASLYSYEYINTWDEANIAALTATDTTSSASGEASSEASGEASGEM